jgi:hypothetical protein
LATFATAAIGRSPKQDRIELTKVAAVQLLSREFYSSTEIAGYTSGSSAIVTDN